MNAPKLAATDSAADRLIGVSAWARKIRDDIRRTASFRSSVLITGPTGTGKELIARALHESSDRRSGPFIPVNSAAAAPQLFASHLFGHEKGAFTGADYATLGCFRAANSGVVFLDEIGELDLDLQAKLLRVLQEKQVVPVGSYDAVPVDTRILSATNRQLEQEVAAGRFREDLFYRLNVVTLSTVPLVARPDDVPLLADYCLKRIAEENGLPLRRLTDEAVEWMQRYAWPGNVRQMQNVLERAVIYSGEALLTAAEIRAAVTDGKFHEQRSPAHPPDGESPRLVSGNTISVPPMTERDVCRGAAGELSVDPENWVRLADLEAYHIRLTLQQTFYNQTAAADLLGISYRTLSRKIKRHGIDISRSRRGRPKKR